MNRPDRPPSRALPLVACALLSACATWRTVDPGTVARGDVDVRGRPAEVTTAEGTRTIEVHRLRDGMIEGSDQSTGEEVAAALASVRALRSLQRDEVAAANATFWGITGAAAVIVGVVFLSTVNP